jgi:hypothetical protein
MSRVPSLFAAALAAWMAASPARADDATEIMARFSGEWLGTGQLLIGPQNGLQFHCALTGDPHSRLGFGMTGRCWMGALSAPVYAALHYNAETDRFYGEFMDGADGDGVDIVAAPSGEGVSMRLTRGSAQGRVTTEAVNRDQFKATLFYRDRRHGRDVPVVAMGFSRKGTVATLPDFLPRGATGTMASSK